jgi:hypothetical protein
MPMKHRRVEPKPQEPGIDLVGWPDQHHPLAEADTNASRDFGCQPKIGPLTTVEDVAEPRFGSCNALLIGFLADVRRLIQPEDAGSDILRSNDIRSFFRDYWRRVRAIEYALAEVIET